MPRKPEAQEPSATQNTPPEPPREDRGVVPPTVSGVQPKMETVFANLSQQIGDAAVREAQLQSIIAAQQELIQGLQAELVAKNSDE
jgi:hypothetical protein